MKKIFTLALLSIISINIFSQALTLTDLHTISKKTNWEYVNQYLLNKKWNYFQSSKGSSSKYNTITWSYEKSSYNDKALGWFYLFTYDGLPNKISYSVFNKPAYTTIQNSLSSFGYKLTESKINDDELLVKYDNGEFILEIRTEKRQRKEDYDFYGESFTAYNFLLIKKSGVYDPDNGKKVEYYDNGKISIEYTLKNGEFEGQLKTYHENGKLKKVGNYTNGKGNGLFKTYHDNGVLEMEFYLLNNKGNGLFKEYNEEGKKIYEYYKKDGLFDGLSIDYIYGENGELLGTESGQYVADERNGKWNLVRIEDGIEKPFTFETYTMGIKNGPFTEVKGDSLIVGNYYQGKLDGEYKIYRDLLGFIFGRVIHTDTNNLILFEEGIYLKNSKEGTWKYYDYTKALRGTGNFYLNEMSGEWKYYFTKYTDSNKNPLEYSEKLYLIKNYANGKLNGESKRFAFLNEVKYNCIDEKTGLANPNDTCTRNEYEKVYEVHNYKNDQLHGFYEDRDSLNNIIYKGNYSNGKLEGKWIIGEYYIFNNEVNIFYKEGTFINDKMEGEWITYFEKGKIYERKNYKNNLLDGKIFTYNTEGKIVKEKIFAKGDFKELITYDNLGITKLNKYEIFDENYRSYKCRHTKYLIDGSVSTEYKINNNFEIDHYVFEDIFYSEIQKDDKANEDGMYKVADINNNPIVFGKLYKGSKVGLWSSYYYDQKVKIWRTYENDKIVEEKYLNLDESLFSGVFTNSDKDTNTKEERKIKDGFRNGNTVIFSLETNKVIDRVMYKDGLIK